MAHPDKGGTAGLAAQLNAARDRLLDGEGRGAERGAVLHGRSGRPSSSPGPGPVDDNARPGPASRERGL